MIADKVFDLAIGLYACSDATIHDANEIRRIVAALERRLDRVPTDEQVAEALDRLADAAACHALAMATNKSDAQVDDEKRREEQAKDAIRAMFHGVRRGVPS